MPTFVQQSVGKTISAHVGQALARSGVLSLADHFYSARSDRAGFSDLQALEVNGVRRFHSLTVVFSW